MKNGRFDLHDIRLLGGRFQVSQEIGKQYLLELEPDRLLAPCCEAMGIQPKAKRYGGWEARGIAGHSLGHWISACSVMYAATGDQRLYDRAAYAIDVLASLQDEQGYVSGVKRSVYDTVFSGEFEVDRFGLAGEWVPWYSIHKIYAGLIDAYTYMGNEKALAVVCRLADWAKKGTDRLNDAQFKKMLICEFGGMNEVFAQLYMITHNEAYLTLADRFTDADILTPLCECRDELQGKHANTQIPKVIGAAQLFDANSGFEKYRTASEFFYDTVTGHRSYVFGGHSNFEHFDKIDAEPLGTQTCETCNTYNMLKLTEHLYDWEQDSRYFDFYENALFNHILSSQDPETGMKTYFMATTPGHMKVYCSPYDSFWCCTGSGMENPGRYGCDIYYHKDCTLYVNLWIASRVVWNGFTLAQYTEFPSESVSRLVVEDGNGRFTLKLRIPSWCSAFSVAVNGEQVQLCTENGYACIDRVFSKGDVITWEMNMELSVYTAKDDIHKIAFRYGPISLCGVFGKEKFPETDILPVHTALDNFERISIPPIVCDDSILKHIRMTDRKELMFELSGLANTDRSFPLKPYFNTHHERYTLYWSWYTVSEYEENQKEVQNYQMLLDSVTIDSVRPNEQQPEIDHNMQCRNSVSGYSPLTECGWRIAVGADGYFSYDMRVEPNKQNYVMVSYWGSDDHFTMDEIFYARSFEILANDTVIAQRTLRTEAFGNLIHDFYEIPLSDKEAVTITFRTKGNSTAAGGVFGVRITREKISGVGK